MNPRQDCYRSHSEDGLEVYTWASTPASYDSRYCIATKTSQTRHYVKVKNRKVSPATISVKATIPHESHRAQFDVPTSHPSIAVSGHEWEAIDVELLDSDEDEKWVTIIPGVSGGAARIQTVVESVPSIFPEPIKVGPIQITITTVV